MVLWYRARTRAAAATRAADRAIARLGLTPRGPHRDRDLAAAADRAADRIVAETERGDRFQAALHDAPLGVIVVDATHSVVFSNEGARRYLAGRHGDAVAEVQVKECIEETAQHGVATTRKVELYTPTRRVLGLHAAPLTAAGQPAGVVVFLEDLTQRNRVDSIRKDFVANASHELKTPLGALSVLAETLAYAEDPATRARLSGRLAVETQRMAHLIDDILNLSLVESTAGAHTPVAVDAVFTDALANVAFFSEEYRVPIETTWAGPATTVAGDHRQLVSAVSNLLENAIKYTVSPGPADHAPVELIASRNESHATIVVRDHGIGIPEQHLPRIFERFYRVDRARSRQTGGTGLGLAIVRHVVRNHDGTIEVSSSPVGGSAFTMTLPLWSE